MKLPRFLHRWYAFCFGYFWKPCPVCGREFGGHECRFGPQTFLTTEAVKHPDGHYLFIRGMVTCGHRDCLRMTQALNDERYPGSSRVVDDKMEVT